MGRRFNTPTPGEEYASEYDIPSQEIADLIARSPTAVKVIDLNLDAAGTLSLPSENAFGFALYGYTRATLAKYAEAFVQVGINCDDVNSDPTKVFPAKTGRGFYGFFTKLALSWPADPNGPGNSAKLYIFKSKFYPWIGGEEAT